MTNKIGIYPGTFDPITHGHLDIIKRALPIVDHLIIGVAAETGKTPLFELEERVALVKETLASLPSAHAQKVQVMPFDGLLVGFAQAQQATVLIRGLRAVSDFEYEFQMAAMNKKVAPALETIFLMASDQYQFIASRFIKEMARLGADVSPFIGKPVERALLEKIQVEG